LNKILLISARGSGEEESAASFPSGVWGWGPRKIGRARPSASPMAWVK